MLLTPYSVISLVGKRCGFSRNGRGTVICFLTSTILLWLDGLDSRMNRRCVVVVWMGSRRYGRLCQIVRKVLSLSRFQEISANVKSGEKFH